MEVPTARARALGSRVREAPGPVLGILCTWHLFGSLLFSRDCQRLHVPVLDELAILLAASSMLAASLCVNFHPSPEGSLSPSHRRALRIPFHRAR